jgi:hypothetical protein
MSAPGTQQVLAAPANAALRGPTRPHPHAQHPGAAARRRKPARTGHGKLVAGLTVVLATGLILAATLSARPSGSPSDILAAEMEAAAAGSGATRHSLGGPLTVLPRKDGLNVVADKVPPAACVQASWRLAQKGVITVNGVFMARLSAAKLSEVCFQVPDGAKIAWAISR